MDLFVTSNDTNISGIYREAGTYNNAPYYKHESAEYYIYYSNGNYTLASGLGDSYMPLYYSPIGTPLGNWTLAIGTPGNEPVVTEYMTTTGTITGFTVAGTSSTINVDGIYTLTNLDSGYSADPRVFSNGTYYLARFTDVGGWYFSTTYNTNFDEIQGVKAYDVNSIPLNDPAAAAATAEPSDVVSWKDFADYEILTYSITPIYGDDSGGDTPDTPSGGKVIAYVVDNSGSPENHGTYNYLDDYNGYPRYEMKDSAGMSLQIYWGDTYMPPGAMGWMLRNPGGTAYGAPNSPADSTPENAPWTTGMTGTAPLPTFTPVYEESGDDTGEDSGLTGTIKLTISGIDGTGSPNLVWGSWMNGDYYLVDSTATGKDRVWQHENPDYTSQIRYKDNQWILTNNSTSTGYSIYISTLSLENPYNEDYSSYSWMREGNSAPNISVVASVVSGDSGEDVPDEDEEDIGNYVTLNLSTNGSRVKISGCGTSEVNGVYTSITCDGKTQPTSSTYNSYKYMHSNGQYYLHIYQYSSYAYYWRICNFAGNAMYYHNTTNSTSSGVAIDNLTFPWADASVPWYVNSGISPAPNYFNIEFCGNIPSWDEGGLIYGDNFTVTLTNSGTQIKLVYDDSYREFKPYPTADCVWSNVDGFRIAWQTRTDNSLPSSYQVSGAGSTYVNGVYEYYQDYQNKPAYKLKTSTDAYYLFYSGTYWMINSQLSTSYPSYMNYSSGSSETPPASGWTYSSGSSPAPTISEIPGGYGWWSCTYNGTEMYKTTEIAKTLPQQFPWEYLSHQYIKVNGTEDITMTSPGSRIVFKGTGNTSLDGKTLYSLTDDENTTLSYTMGTNGYVYKPEWKSEDGYYIIGPYNYYVNSTSGYRWTIRTSGSSVGAYTTNYASNIGDLTTKPWNDETWTENVIFGEFGPSTILYQGRGYRPTGFSNRLEVFGSESVYSAAMGTYDIIGFYWSDATGTTYSNEAEISGGKFYATYARRDVVAGSTQYLLIADNAGIRLGYYNNGEFVTCETGSATMYPQNATWTGSVTVLAAENSHIVPTDSQSDAILTSGETTITATIGHSAYGVYRSWVSSDESQNLSYNKSIAKWECTGQIADTYSPSFTTNDQGLLYVEGPYNNDGSAITYTNGATIAGDVPAGIFKIEGITGTHAAANGNYNLISGTEGTYSAVYKHISAEYYVYSPATYQGYWYLYNSSTLTSMPPSAYAYMGSSGTMYPYNQTGSVTWYDGSGSVGSSMTSTKL